MQSIDFNELEAVNGGFNEANSDLPTSGLNIVCPKCHSRNASSFSPNALYDKKLGTVEYQCKCGCSFVVSHGKAIIKNDFLSLCDAKGINYSFK